MLVYVCPMLSILTLIYSILTANLQRRLQLEQNRLRQEDLTRLQAQSTDFGLGQLDALAGSIAANWRYSVFKV